MRVWSAQLLEAMARQATVERLTPRVQALLAAGPPEDLVEALRRDAQLDAREREVAPQLVTRLLAGAR